MTSLTSVLRSVRSSRRILVAVVLLAASMSVVAFRGQDTITVTAYFAETKGVYVGDDVTILSVPIGQISAIKAEPGRVKVDMKIDADQKLPANVQAAIIGRSLVSVRAIALGPTYDGGDALVSGDTIPITRTAIPVEWDEVKTQLVELATALGPNGMDEKGAANRLVSSTAEFLDGRGASIHRTLDSLASAFQTLDDNRGNLFATVRNLQVFVTAINESDAQVRDFNLRLAKVAQLLAGDRKKLADAVRGMRSAFVEAKKFLAANTDLTASTLRSIDETMSMLAERRTDLANILQVAPTAVSNFNNIIDPRVQAPTGQLAVGNFQSIAGIVCGALTALDPEGGDVACREALSPLLGFLNIDSLPIGINPLSADTGASGAGTATPDEANTLPSGGKR